MASGNHDAVSDFDTMRPPSPVGKSLGRAQDVAKKARKRATRKLGQAKPAVSHR